MPLPIYDTQDAVPQDQRDDYVEHEGKWHPKVVVELATEKQKRATLLDEKKKEQQKREAVEQERDALRQAQDAKESGVTEEQLKKIREEAEKQKKPIEDELAKVRAENRKLLLTDRVRTLYLANEGMADREEDAMDQLAKRTDLGDEGGIVFKDKQGNVTADDAAAFFTKFRTEKPWLFKGTGSGDPKTPERPERKKTEQSTSNEKRVPVAGSF